MSKQTSSPEKSQYEPSSETQSPDHYQSPMYPNWASYNSIPNPFYTNYPSNNHIYPDSDQYQLHNPYYPYYQSQTHYEYMTPHQSYPPQPCIGGQRPLPTGHHTENKHQWHGSGRRGKLHGQCREHHKGRHHTPPWKKTESEIYQKLENQSESTELQTKKGAREQNHQSESSSQTQEETESNAGILDLEALNFLSSRGFNNQQSNLALLKYFSGNREQVLRCLEHCKNEKASRKMLGHLQANFLILSYLGYCDKFQNWKVLKFLENSDNCLKVAIKKLNRKLQLLTKEQQTLKEIEDCQIDMLENIPEGCEFLVDGFNAVRTNKHFKKLTISSSQKDRLQAILRLKTLIETLAPGNLVLDKRFLDDAAEKQILSRIGVDLPGQKQVKVIYADAGLKADDKIVQILRGKSAQERSNILLVTSDRRLIKQCQEVCGIQLQVIGGKKFIKDCKKKLPSGFKNKVMRSK